MSSLTRARISTTKRLAAVELPECWAAATVSSAVNAIDRKRDPKTVRRLVSKALRVSEAV